MNRMIYLLAALLQGEEVQNGITYQRHEPPAVQRNHPEHGIQHGHMQAGNSNDMTDAAELEGYVRFVVQVEIVT